MSADNDLTPWAHNWITPRAAMEALHGYHDWKPKAPTAACEHSDVRYSQTEKGAIACFNCGRLFGHLQDETFHPHNPR